MGEDVAVAKTLTIFLAADTKKLSQGINSANKELTGFGGSLQKVVGPALIAATAAAGALAVKLGVDAVKAASDLGETQNKVGVIFGDSAQQILNFAETSVTALGQTENQALSAAATFAQFGKAAGLSGQGLVDFSSELVTLSADLASFNNSSPEQAITAIGAALRGEAEPLRAFGVLLDDATLKARAMEMGIYEGNGALTQQQKVLAAHQEILSQTTDAQGDFERTSDGLANTSRILSAAIEQAKATIGEGLVDALESATASAGGPEGFARIITDTAEDVGILTRGVGVLIDRLGELAPQSDDTEESVKELERTTLSWTDALRNSADPLSLITNLVYVWGNNAEVTENQIESLYDSTIRLSNLQRMAATEEAIENRKLRDSVRDVGVERLAEAKHIEKLTQLLGHVPGEYEEIEKAQGRAGSSSSDLTSRLDEQAATVQGLRDALRSQVSELERGAAAVNSYVESVAGKILGGLDLGEAYAQQFDEEGNRVGQTLIEAFQAQVNQAEWFGNVLDAIRASGGSERLINAIAAEGPEAGGALGQQIIDQGLIPELDGQLTKAAEAANRVGVSMAATFAPNGVQAAIGMVNGIAERLGKEGKRLGRIGEEMGKPIGARLKAQIAEDVAAAVRAAEAAGAAARAEVVAREEARQAAITQQAIADAVQRLIVNANQRGGRDTNAVFG
jgi:hypothetical protein